MMPALNQAEGRAKSSVNPLLFRIIGFDDAACDVCSKRRSAANRRGGQPSLLAVMEISP
jgi:hypothetical protein